MTQAGTLGRPAGAMHADRRRTTFRPQAGQILAGQVIQNPLDHAQRHSGFASFRWRGKSQSLHCLRWRVFDTRDNPNRSSALRAGLHINLENPLEALRPSHRRALFGRRALLFLSRLDRPGTPAPAGRCDPRPVDFVDWYNHQHKHRGINYVTPHQRHTGQDIEILAKRYAVYQAARDQHPQRWSGDIRDWSPVGTVWLNPEKEEQPKRRAA